MGDSCQWKKGESPSLIEDGKITKCKSENHVPIVTISKEPRIHDDPSEENPGVQALGDRSHKGSRMAYTIRRRPLW